MKNVKNYMRRTQIDPQYPHRIKAMRVDSNDIRIQYNKAVFDALVYYLPPNLSKRLNASKSVMNVVRKDKEYKKK